VNNSLQAGSSLRAPIFYESTNTAYYVDPLTGSYVGGEFGVKQSGTNGFRIYSPTGTQSLWVRAGYDTDGTATPISSPTNIQFQSSGSSGGSFTFVSGNTKALTVSGDYAQGAGSLRAPIFYDSNDTNYYVNPNSGSRLFDLNIEGTGNKYLYIYSTSGNEAMVRYIGGSSSSWYVGKRTAAQLVGTADFHFYSEAAGATVAGIDTAGNIFANSSVRAPIFYDSNDTSYNLDPNGTSVLNGINVWGEIGPRRNDVQSLLRSYNTSAGSPLQFFLDHNYANVDIGNNRGAIFGYGTYWEFANSARAPIFYDSDNTGYYFNGAGISQGFGFAIRGDQGSTATQNQLFLWDAGNTTTSAIGFKANGGDFTNPTGNGDGYNTYFTMDTDGRGWVFRRGTGGTNFAAAYTSGWILNNGIWQAQASMRAPIFYDSNDTGYYIDPNATSVCSTVQAINFQATAAHGNGYRFWASDSYKIYMSSSGNGTWGGRVAGETTSDYNMYFRMTGGTNRGFVFSAGSAGTTKVAGIDASGNGRFIGDVVAYSSSDARLKENLEVIPNALDKVQALSGYTFDWNDKQDAYEVGKRDVGVIAQDVEAVLPEVVVDRELTGYKAVNYEKLVPLLIEAIKELKAEVETLKKG